MRIQRREQSDLPVGRLSTIDKARPEIADHVKHVSARRGEERLCPSDRFLNVDVVTQDLGRLYPLAECIASRRLSAADSISVSIARRAMPSAGAGPFAMNIYGNA